jgi:PAB-dependent poly(A)-specific ribonuclease subunit 2
MVSDFYLHVLLLIEAVAPSSRDVGESDQWHLFNDFLVQQITKEDALKFDSSWKLPSVVAYQLKSANHHIDDSWKENLDTSLLFTQVSPLLVLFSSVETPI